MGFCTKPTAHRSRRREEPGGAGVRPGRHGRLGGTTTGTNRDSRRGTGNGGNGSARGFQGAFFSGGGCGRLVAGVAGAGPAPVCWRMSGNAGNGGPVEDHSQATQAANPRRAQDGDEVHDRHGSALGEYVLPVFGYLVRAEGFLVQAEDAARPPPLVLVTRNSGEGSTLSASNRMELVDDVSAAPGRRHHIRLARH